MEQPAFADFGRVDGEVYLVAVVLDLQRDEVRPAARCPFFLELLDDVIRGLGFDGLVLGYGPLPVQKPW